MHLKIAHYLEEIARVIAFEQKPISLVEEIEACQISLTKKFPLLEIECLPCWEKANFLIQSIVLTVFKIIAELLDHRNMITLENNLTIKLCLWDIQDKKNVIEIFEPHGSVINIYSENIFQLETILKNHFKMRQEIINLYQKIASYSFENLAVQIKMHKTTANELLPNLNKILNVLQDLKKNKSSKPSVNVLITFTDAPYRAIREHISVKQDQETILHLIKKRIEEVERFHRNYPL